MIKFKRLDVGDVKLPVDPATEEISFPPNFCQIQPSKEELEKKVLRNIAKNFKNLELLSSGRS